MENQLVCDVSRWNGSINFAKMKSMGIDGIMARASYGKGKDKCFDEYCANALKQGLPVGAYAFATWHYKSVSPTVADARSNAIAQAENLIAILKGKGVNGFVALDLELESGQSLAVGKADLTVIANEYMRILKANGFNPCVYASISWFIDRMNIEAIEYPLWVAFYHSAGLKGREFPIGTYGDTMRKYKDKIIMWQFSSKFKGADFGCQSTYLDMNHLYGDFAQNPKVEAKVEPTPTNPTTYKVKAGDTMTRIAKNHGMSLSQLIRLNPQIKNPNVIKVGETINLASAPKPTTPTATPKPTLIKTMQSAKSFTKGYSKGKEFVTTQTTPLRFGDGEKYAVISNLNKGTRVKWYGYYTNDYLFVMAKGKSGFIKKSHLK